MTLTERITALEIELQALKRETEQTAWPKKGDTYWFIGSDGMAYKNEWDGYGTVKNRQKIGNVYRTKEGAEMYALRLESMATRWKPDKNEIFFTWATPNDGGDYRWHNDVFDIPMFSLGRCFKTEAAADAHQEKYKAAWDALEQDL